jgi:hypothetical protein
MSGWYTTMKLWQCIMTVGTIEFALWLPLMSTSRWIWRIEPDDAVVHDSQVYFILEKYIVTIHLWNHKNNHGTVVLTKNPTLVNVMESSHTYNCVHIHALKGYYDCCHWWNCSNMKGNHVSQQQQLLLYWHEGSLWNVDWIWCKSKLSCLRDPCNEV